MARNQHPIAPSHADQPEQPAGHLVLYHYRNAAQGDNPENIPLPLFVGQPHPSEFILLFLSTFLKGDLRGPQRIG
jgi:hypothetical protein